MATAGPGAEFWLGDKNCLVRGLGMGSAPPSCSLCCQNNMDLASWKTGTSKLQFVCLGPDLRAGNVLCSGVVVVVPSTGICQAGFY